MTPPTDIRTWLAEHNLSDLTPQFEANAITPDMLLTLNADELREMGINAVGHRKKLLAAIALLKAPAAEPVLVAVAVPVVEPEPMPVAVAVAVAVAPPPKSPFSSPPVASLPLPTPNVVPSLPQPGARPPSNQPKAPPQPTADALIETLPAPSSGQSPKPKRKGFSASFLAVSIALHVLLGLGAGYWVVQQINAKRKLQFAAGPPTVSPSKRALEHKVSLQKKKNAGGAPAQARRIAVTGLAANITLPEMPSMPNSSTQIVAGRMAGMGGAGFGTGMGFGNGSGMGVGGMGKGGLGLTMFGARGGVGLVGTFYDLKRDAGGKSTGVKQNRPLYTKVLKDFTKSSIWKMPSNVKCYTGKSKLVAKAFIFPAIPDSEAGKAFNEPEAGAGMWIAHYSGMVKVPVSGKYRFVGWGDNLMAVRLGAKIVLDASDIGYLAEGDNRHGAGSVSFPKKAGTPLLAGSWMTLTAGSMMKMDVLLGDEGGIYCAGLLLEKEGSSAGTGKHNIPELPIFLAGPLSSEERGLYDNYVPAKSLSGPVFSATGGGSSPLDMLKR